MRRIALATLLSAACTSPRPTLDASSDLVDAAPEASVDATMDTGFDAHRNDAGIDVPRVTLPPSSRTLSDLVGIASNPGDFPLGADAASTARRAFYYRKMLQAGIHRVRRDFSWIEIEPTQGSFTFTNYDQLVTEATASGIDILATLDYGNPWATSHPDASAQFPPDDPNTFANYAAHTASHFLGRVHRYEIWNEPNNGFRFWLPTFAGDPVAYGALCLAASRAVLGADPDAGVAFGGTVFLPELIPGGLQFSAEAFDATPGLAQAISVFAIHAYDYYAPAKPPEDDSEYEVPLLDKLARTGGMLQGAGFDLTRPIWITEIGWPVWSAVTEAQQAQYTVRAILLSALGGADGVYLYTLGDGPHPEAYPPEDAFGLVHYDPDFADGVDPADKPSFTALAALEQTLGAYRVQDRVQSADMPSDVFVVHLTQNGRDAWAIWRVDASAAAYAWMVPAAVTAVASDGHTIGSQSAGSTVAVGVDPIYLTAN